MKIPESGPTLKQILDSTKELPTDEKTRKFAKEFNERYLHWDDLKYRELGTASKDDVWALMKILRQSSASVVCLNKLNVQYNIPGEAQKALHDIDIGSSIDKMPSDDDRRIMLSISSMMEESIASSQLEGASTTTKLAKKLLRNNSVPENRSQQMILNNYRAMQLIKQRANEPLSAELIKDIHRTISYNTLEDASFEGEFRVDNDIAVRDAFEDVTYYIPIDHKDIGLTIESLCRYVNDDTVFVHPIIKGIVLHFLMAYIHPFVDGNGRVSRALFYWYAIKNGYSIVEFLSISKVIKSHRQQYDLAYLRTETDDNDLTYFIQYNLKMMIESMELFSKYLERKVREQKDTMDKLHDYGLNLRQSVILKDMIRNGEPVSVQELSVKYNATQITIRRDLITLMNLGFVNLSGKDGHKQLYRYSGKEQ